MFDILDFIDSEEIRELNKNTVFAPMEQAILISQSLKTSVEQKLYAWKMLIEQYSEEEFQDAHVGYMTGSDVCFKAVIQKEIERYKKALSYRKTIENAVFGARLYEEAFPENASDNRFFSTYEKAFAFLKKEKQYYLDDEDLKEVRMHGIIDIEWLDQEGFPDYVTFYFDDQLTMTKISACFKDEEDWADMSLYSMYVPLPFEKGDILRSIDRNYYGERVYGVLSHEVNNEWMIGYLRDRGDASDMSVTLDTIWKEGERIRLGHEHWKFLHMERCPEDELPEDQQFLKKIAEMRRKNMEPREFAEADHVSAR